LALSAILFVQGDAESAVRDLSFGGLLLGGTLAAGLLMGVILGAGLALVARVVTRPWGLALVGALLGALTFPAEIIAVAAGSDAGPGEVATTLLAWPVMVVVAAVHSADIAGLTHKRRWLQAAGRR
jgi:hypothetical protein